MNQKHKVFLVEHLRPEFEEYLQENAEVRVATNTERNVIAEEVRDADAIIIRAKGKIDKAVIDSAPCLKVIGRHGIGVDHIDLLACQERGIAVYNTPDANTISTAEFTFALILAVSRKLRNGDELVRSSTPWKHADALMGNQLQGKNLGIVGMGRIGKRVAKIATHGFGMNVLYWDYLGRDYAKEGIPGTSSSIEQLLVHSDFVTIHLPLLPSTRGFIDRKYFDIIKRGAYFVNTSRGAVVEESALIDSLKSGYLAGAALDVMAVEPLGESELRMMPNTVLTPHMASYTLEGFSAMGRIVYDVVSALNGNPPISKVI